MLILPLHRPLNRATFPFVTAILVVLNVLVFGLAQRGDDGRMQALSTWYEASGLVQQDWPGYLAWLERQGDAQALAEAKEVLEEYHAAALFHRRLMDARLDRALRAESTSAAAEIDPHDVPAVAPSALQTSFDARLSQITTYRYLLRHSEIDPVRIVGHAFLHGGVMHLVGNMLFLIALGLLVEGALGEWRFALLYLLGILGSAAFSLSWHWGEFGGGLGASGAIASLMGAFCVIWGRRPVRFFWWFFVAFGYIRKPAIWLLPAWIGWEAWNLIFNADAGIGFDAHLGGLVSGALVGWLMVRAGHVRENFFVEQTPSQDRTARIEQARRALARMELAQAATTLDTLLETVPEDLETVLLRQRVASLMRDAVKARHCALAALTMAAADADQVASQFALLETALPANEPVPSGAWRTHLRRRWQSLGQFAQVEQLLDRWFADEADAKAWFELALARRDAGDAEGFRANLRCIVSRYSNAPEAAKARFLLEQDG